MLIAACTCDRAPEEKLARREQTVATEKLAQLDHGVTRDPLVHRESGETEENRDREVFQERSGRRVHPEKLATMGTLEYPGQVVFLGLQDLLETQ